MIPIHDTAAWERPFLVLQNVMDRFVEWTGRLPGTVQLVLYPLALALSLFHIPFALTHLLISAVVHRIYPRELPTLTRDELSEWVHATHAKWVAHHAALRECNPIGVANDIALPVIDALRDATDALDAYDVDCDQLNHLAARLIALPFRTAPDAHTIGLCIQRYVLSNTVN